MEIDDVSLPSFTSWGVVYKIRYQKTENCWSKQSIDSKKIEHCIIQNLTDLNLN